MSTANATLWAVLALWGLLGAAVIGLILWSLVQPLPELAPPPPPIKVTGATVQLHGTDGVTYLVSHALPADAAINGPTGKDVTLSVRVPSGWDNFVVKEAHWSLRVDGVSIGGMYALQPLLHIQQASLITINIGVKLP